ncbi:hypothetical protein CBR_g19049 [Chara braunii]|uniref:RING-type domain-containing protein n=1 Tax=Chara braunii TaxID=69332 RepID=A0A388KXD8_CHABU|nr:hypothetical protein CBR_g19049 [Chara braunii]|eukprot:GBG74642.1 hypothetical protein CBR_g19049 [Chara braunii]
MIHLNSDMNPAVPSGRCPFMRTRDSVAGREMTAGSGAAAELRGGGETVGKRGCPAARLHGASKCAERENAEEVGSMAVMEVSDERRAGCRAGVEEAEARSGEEYYPRSSSAGPMGRKTVGGGGGGGEQGVVPRPSTGEEVRARARALDGASGAGSGTDAGTAAGPSPRCPLGYDAGGGFRIGPLSCVICRALLYDSFRCVPCRHVYCRVCISRFSDCPLCGADIERLEPDAEMQSLIDKFIDGHGRARPRHRQTVVGLDPATVDAEIAAAASTAAAACPRKACGADVASSSPGSMKDDVGGLDGVGGEGYLLRQAMLAFVGQNYESARSRLLLCLEDAQAELASTSTTADGDWDRSTERICHVGAVLGSLGDACRMMGDDEGALRHYEESVKVLSRAAPPAPGANGDEDEDCDSEVVHALAVSHNKVGDLHYRANDLDMAAASYREGLRVRKEAANRFHRRGRILHAAARGSIPPSDGGTGSSAGREGGGQDFSALTPPSLVVDIAVSLAKVADVARAQGNEAAALRGFREAKDIVDRLMISRSNGGGNVDAGDGCQRQSPEGLRGGDRQLTSLVTFLSSALGEAPKES